MVAIVFLCAIPASRVHHAQRAEGSVVDVVQNASRRRGLIMVVLLLTTLAIQPSMGVCGPPTGWAETTQMALDVSILATATDALWV